MSEVTTKGLPAGWQLCKLGDVMRLKNGYAFKSKDYSESGTPLIRISDLKEGVVSLDKAVYIPDELVNEDFLVKNGDLLIAMSGATTGKIGVYKGVNPALQNQRVGNFKIFDETVVNKRYRDYYISSLRKDIEGAAYGGAQPNISSKGIEEFEFPLAPLQQQKRIVAKIEELFSHIDAGIEALKKAKQLLKQYRQSVLKAAVTGKLTEQWRLSALAKGRARAQASELKSLPKKQNGKYFVYIIECDDGSYYIGFTNSLADRFLAHCEGKGAAHTKKHSPKYLIHYEVFDSEQYALKREKDLKTGFGRTWRKREVEAGRIKPIVHNKENKTALPVHDTGMQTGEQLLEHILKERHQKWEEQQLEQFKAKGKVTKDDKWKEKYKEPDSYKASPLFDIPDSWLWVYMGQLGDVVGGLTKNKKREQLELQLPYLRVANVYANELRLNDVTNIGVQENELNRVLLKKGDMLIVEGNGSPDQIGRLAIWDGSIEPCVHQNHIIKVRLSEMDSGNYLMYWLSSIGGRDAILQVASSTSGLYTLSISKISGLPVPLPPLVEQIEINKLVSTKLNSIERLEKDIVIQLLRANKNKQSVLASAFKGELH